MTTPYGDAAEDYRAIGWTGTIPLPPQAKSPPPSGFTGDNGAWPTPDNLAQWRNSGFVVGRGTERRTLVASNIALRLPPTVIGFDVDDYADKHGADVMRMLASKLGPLPSTARTTSRNDNASGIYFYRISTGLSWPTEVGPHVEIIRHGHRYAVVSPSIHPSGQRYCWRDGDGAVIDAPSPGSLPHLPATWVEHLTGTDPEVSRNGVRALPGRRARQRAELKPARHWLRGLDTADPCSHAGRVSADALAAARREDGAAYDATRDAVAAMLRAAERGHVGIGGLLPRVRDTYIGQVAQDRGGASVAAGEFDRFTETGAATILGTPTADADKGCRCHVTVTTTDTTAQGRRARLAALIGDLSSWQHLPDPSHLVIALAVAATRDDSGEPCWLLLVAAPSSGKTEVVRMLDDAADEHLDEVTAAGMLGWSKGKVAKPTGVLARIGDRALITFGDLSSLLASSDRGGRDAVFALLRRAYDGSASRDISPPGRTEGEHAKLSWTGRLTVVAAVTGVIDRYSAHADQLGPRWVYVRLPDRDTAGKRSASRMARRRGVSEHRAAARQATQQLVTAAKSNLPDELPDDVADQIEDASLVTCWGRAAVPRSGYGGREILDVPTIEEPMRVVQQISAIARGLYGLGLDDTAVTALCRRVALDSMPAARRAVLNVLASGELLTTAGVARNAGLDRKVARFSLEELEAVGVAVSDRVDEESEAAMRTVTWRLNGHDGDLIAHVFAGHRRNGGWDNMWVAIPPPPKIGEVDIEAPHVSSHPLSADLGTACAACGTPIPLSLNGLTVCLSCTLKRQAAS